MVGRREIVLSLVAAQLSVVIGSICASLLITSLPGSTATISADLVLAIMAVAFPFVNLVSVLVFLPLYVTQRISVEATYFLWGGTLFGGLVYLLVNLTIAGFSGTDTLGQFLATRTVVFTFLIGVIFAGWFCLSLKLLLKLSPK